MDAYDKLVILLSVARIHRVENSKATIRIIRSRRPGRRSPPETGVLGTATRSLTSWHITERLAIGAKTAAHSRAKWVIIDRLLQALSSSRGCLLKAFPLKYEDNFTVENRKLFERRKRAVVRLYQGRARRSARLVRFSVEETAG